MRATHFAALSAAVGLAGVLGSSPALAACTQTGFYRDSINMTAAVIATGDITDQTINATGCNIGSSTDREPAEPSTMLTFTAPTTSASW